MSTKMCSGYLGAMVVRYLIAKDKLTLTLMQPTRKISLGLTQKTKSRTFVDPDVLPLFMCTNDFI